MIKVQQQREIQAIIEILRKVILGIGFSGLALRAFLIQVEQLSKDCSHVTS